MTEWNDRIVDADHLTPSQKLAKEMGETLRPAQVEQPLTGNARLEHCAPPQCETKLRILLQRLFMILAANGPDRAVGQRRNCHGSSRARQHIPMKITKIPGMLECINLPTAVLLPFI